MRDLAIIFIHLIVTVAKLMGPGDARAIVAEVHAMLVKRKYRQLFSLKRGGKPGPKGPSPELI